MATTTALMPPEKKPKTETARIRTDLIKKARVVAAHRDLSVPDYLDLVLRPAIERDYAKLPASIEKILEAEEKADEEADE